MSHAHERADFWSQHEPIARKPHQCSACGETVPQGTKYRRIARGCDGSVDTIKQCARCAAIFDAICREDPQALVLPELDCGESWQDTFGEPEPEPVAELAFMLPSDVKAGGWPS